MRFRSRAIQVIVLLALLAGVVYFAPSASADAGTCITVASKDSWTDEKITSASHRTENVLRALIKSRNRRWPHVGFDVSCLPAGVTIAGARVEFTPRITINQTALRVWKSQSATWGEAALTWANQPADVANSSTPSRTQHAAGVPETYELPASGLPTGNGLVAYQMREVATGSNPEVEFHSREATSGAPRLLIDWTSSGEPTTTTSAPITTTVAPTTAVAPTATTTAPPPDCLLTSNFASPQAAVNATPIGGCLIADQYHTLTSSLSVNKRMTLKCLGHTNGFTGTFTGALVNIGSNVSDAVFDGCRLESSGTSSPTEGLSLHGTLTRVTVSNLLIKNIKVGIAGSAKTFFVRVTGNRCENLWGTCIAFYFGTDRDLEIDNNTVVNHQRGGTAGHAGIQLGGISATSNEDKHSRVNVHHNTVDNSASCPPNNGDLVGIGLDQVSSSTIDDNVVRHCTDQQTSDPSQRGNGEGIVVVGPDNTVRRNQVYNVGSGAYTFISGSTPPQQVRNLIFQGNLADGNPADGGNQGVALSFAPSGLPMTGLLIGGPNSEHRNRILEHSYGIQAYSFGGTVSGSNNTIQNNDLTGNILGPCLILSGLQYTSISNVPSC